MGSGTVSPRRRLAARRQGLFELLQISEQTIDDKISHRYDPRNELFEHFVVLLALAKRNSYRLVLGGTILPGKKRYQRKIDGKATVFAAILSASLKILM